MVIAIAPAAQTFSGAKHRRNEKILEHVAGDAGRMRQRAVRSGYHAVFKSVA